MGNGQSQPLTVRDGNVVDREHQESRGGGIDGLEGGSARADERPGSFSDAHDTFVVNESIGQNGRGRSDGCTGASLHRNPAQFSGSAKGRAVQPHAKDSPAQGQGEREIVMRTDSQSDRHFSPHGPPISTSSSVRPAFAPLLATLWRSALSAFSHHPLSSVGTGTGASHADPTLARAPPYHPFRPFSHRASVSLERGTWANAPSQDLSGRSETGSAHQITPYEHRAPTKDLYLPTSSSPDSSHRVLKSSFASPLSPAAPIVSWTLSGGDGDSGASTMSTDNRRISEAVTVSNDKQITSLPCHHFNDTDAQVSSDPLVDGNGNPLQSTEHSPRWANPDKSSAEVLADLEAGVTVMLASFSTPSSSSNSFNSTPAPVVSFRPLPVLPSHPIPLSPPTSTRAKPVPPFAALTTAYATTATASSSGTTIFKSRPHSSLHNQLFMPESTDSFVGAYSLSSPSPLEKRAVSSTTAAGIPPGPSLPEKFPFPIISSKPPSSTASSIAQKTMAPHLLRANRSARSSRSSSASHTSTSTPIPGGPLGNFSSQNAGFVHIPDLLRGWLASPTGSGSGSTTWSAPVPALPAAVMVPRAQQDLKDGHDMLHNVGCDSVVRDNIRSGSKVVGGHPTASTPLSPFRQYAGTVPDTSAEAPLSNSSNLALAYGVGKFSSTGTLLVEETIATIGRSEAVECLAAHLHPLIWSDQHAAAIAKSRSKHSSASALPSYSQAFSRAQAMLSESQHPMFPATSPQHYNQTPHTPPSLPQEKEVLLCGDTWRRAILGSLVVAAKVWDDCAVWNVDFVGAEGGQGGAVECEVEDINALERFYLTALDYDVNVTPAEYAKAFFDMRSHGVLNKVRGLATMIGRGKYADSAKRKGKDESESAQNREKWRMDDGALPPLPGSKRAAGDHLEGLRTDSDRDTDGIDLVSAASSFLRPSLGAPAALNPHVLQYSPSWRDLLPSVLPSLSPLTDQTFTHNPWSDSPEKNGYTRVGGPPPPSHAQSHPSRYSAPAGASSFSHAPASLRSPATYFGEPAGSFALRSLSSKSPSSSSSSSTAAQRFSRITFPATASLQTPSPRAKDVLESALRPLSVLEGARLAARDDETGGGPWGWLRRHRHTFPTSPARRRGDACVSENKGVEPRDPTQYTANLLPRRDYLHFIRKKRRRARAGQPERREPELRDGMVGLWPFRKAVSEPAVVAGIEVGPGVVGRGAAGLM
ncbi:hypothetical protein HDU93_000034 [Gonapodya sp. JEL0774]|nr:hypothetical protein HDU93_000034 [Gonapodya sp. JEL0774]